MFGWLGHIDRMGEQRSAIIVMRSTISRECLHGRPKFVLVQYNTFYWNKITKYNWHSNKKTDGLVNRLASNSEISK